MAGLNYDRTLSRYTEKIQNSESISEKNKEAILRFQKKCIANGLGIKRVCKYMWILKAIAERVDFDFKTATRDNIEDYIAWLQRSEYTEWTKHDYKVALKMLYKHLWGEDDEYPKVVKWVKTTVNGKYKEEEFSENVLTPEDIEKLIMASKDLRMKAMIRFLFEAGPRIEELRGMRIKDIRFDQDTADVVLSGKTGTRIVPVVDSVPLFTQVLEIHPSKDPDAYFGFTMGTNGDRMSYSRILEALNLIGQKAKIRKKLNPHNFRHSSASYMSDFMTESQMCAYYGWVQGSDQVRTYVHRNPKNLKKAVRRMHNLDDDPLPANKMSPKECQRCGKYNDSTADLCGQCGWIFDRGKIIEKKKKQLVVEMVMNKVIEDNPGIKQWIEEASKKLSVEIERVLKG